MAEYTNRYTRAFVVFSYNQGYEDRIQNYLEMNYLREDQQILSHELEVRVYKLRYLEKNN